MGGNFAKEAVLLKPIAVPVAAIPQSGLRRASYGASGKTASAARSYIDRYISFR